MDIAQAKRELGRFVRVFKAVEHMEEAMTAATGVEETVNSLKREKLKLSSDIKKLDEDKAKKLKDYDDLYSQWDAQMRIRKDDYDRQTKDYNKSYREAKIWHDQKVKELEDKLKAKQADHQRALAAFAAERQEAEEAVVKANRELEQLKNRLANVG